MLNTKLQVLHVLHRLPDPHTKFTLREARENESTDHCLPTKDFSLRLQIEIICHSKLMISRRAFFRGFCWKIEAAALICTPSYTTFSNSD